MRLTKPMLETIRRALMKYDVLTEKSEEEEELTTKAWEWVDAELERRETRKSKGRIEP